MINGNPAFDGVGYINRVAADTNGQSSDVIAAFADGGHQGNSDRSTTNSGGQTQIDCNCGVLQHLIGGCKAKPIGSGPLYEAAKKHGAISGELHNDLTKATANIESARLPYAENTGDAAMALAVTVSTPGIMVATTLPGVGEGSDIAVVTDPESTELEVAIAEFSLLLSAGSYGFLPNFGHCGKFLRGFAAKKPNTPNITNISTKPSTNFPKTWHPSQTNPAPQKIVNDIAANVPYGASKIRNDHLAGGVHAGGVPFDKDGFPVFQVKKEVKIKYTGTYKGDFAAANKKAGYKETPKGMTWHHHQDGVTMQLVDKETHKKTGHTGGFSLHPKK